MSVVAMLPFVLVAAAIALLVLRGNAGPRRHAPVRPPALERPELPGHRRAPAAHQPLAVEKDTAPLFGNARLASERVLAARRPALARATAHARAHPTLAIAVVGVVALIVMLSAILAQPGEASPRAAARPTNTNAPTATATTGASAPAPATAQPSATATATPTPAATDSGAPLSGEGLLAAWTAAGLQVAAAEQPAPCGPTRPRAYRANGSQVAIVFVYASPPALSADWAVERGSPLTFRGGPCLPAGSVTYWNQNIVLSFPQLTNQGVKQQMSDALLGLTR